MREKVAKAAGGTGEDEAGEDAYDGEDVDEAADRKAKRIKIENGEEANDDDASTKKKRRRHKKSHHTTSMDQEP